MPRTVNATAAGGVFHVLCVSSVCRILANFIVGLFNLYEDLFFTYLEINPLGRLSSLLLFVLRSSVA